MTTVYEATAKWIYGNDDKETFPNQKISYRSTGEVDVARWIETIERNFREGQANQALNLPHSKDVTGVEFTRKTITITEG